MVDETGETAILRASRQGHAAVVQSLLAAKAKPVLTSGLLVLWFALRKGGGGKCGYMQGMDAFRASYSMLMQLKCSSLTLK